MARARKKKAWSYSTGSRGRNRVRVFEDLERRTIYAEFYEAGADGDRNLRRRISLGHADRNLAQAKAEEMAAAFRHSLASRQEPPDLASLFDIYEREVTPRKSIGKQKHDRRAIALFLDCFGGSAKPADLNRRDWDRFIRDRGNGSLSPSGKEVAGPVRNRVIEYDLRFLLAVLNWASTSNNEAGIPLLVRNPLKGLPLPREASPLRPTLTQEQYEAIRAVAPTVGPEFSLMLLMAHETGHRSNAIRLLRWNDVLWQAKKIRWRGEHDKIGYAHETVLTEMALQALQGAPWRVAAGEEGWVFPSPGDCLRPCSRHLVRDWWRRAALKAGLKGVRLGYHALRRKFATDLRNLPLKDLLVAGGWKDAQTILKCYQQPDPESSRSLLEERSRAAAGTASAT